MNDPDQLRRLSIEQWLDKAAADLHAATLVLEGGGEPWIAAFHAQQATEKCMKALLVAWQIHFPRTHDLGELRKLIGKSDPSIETELKAVDALTPYAVLDRYPSPDPNRLRTVTQADAQDAIETARHARDAISKHLRPFLDTQS